MQPVRPLEVLFLTDFSNASYRTIPAIAQMADELEIRLTLLHACASKDSNVARAESKLQSFFPESGCYQGSQRIVLQSDVVDAVRQVRREQPVDLIVAPSSDPLGLPHPWHHSLRATLIANECGPVWTMGQSIHSVALNRRTKNVGCWIDLDSSDKRHISLAFTYASALGAKLHLLSAMPSVDEGTLISTLYTDSPLYPDGVAHEIQDLVGWVPVKPEVHVRSGSPRRVIPQQAAELGLDILFVSKRNAVRNGWMKMSLGAAVDRSPCPVICSDGASGYWNLKRGQAFSPYSAAMGKAA